jgi:hypothetical protein
VAITDAERHRLHTKLDEVLGEEDAAVLISHLPPSGWSDVARTRDLDLLEARIDQRFDAIDKRFEATDKRFDAIDKRFDAFDKRFDAFEERWKADERFDAIEKRFDAFEERWKADERFNTMQARTDATIERCMREQTHRFLAYGAALAALVGAVQGVVVGFFGG